MPTDVSIPERGTSMFTRVVWLLDVIQRYNFPCGDDAKGVNENNTKEEQLSVITTLRKQLKKHGFQIFRLI